ncbi:alpha/beta hydrolase [Erythrobacter mangrovi]|uniref:Alpha/beta hydrolase n=1 Tax=Erythrobacter mangrovi TaxID=2739433 RepID=A0A7D4B982_9SPHN|nr:alpha/beta hydrolase [Erythrobacter mangrovi]QKG70841.1 alpha/beta hydrolase [Erythrobacter mangrovi]
MLPVFGMYIALLVLVAATLWVAILVNGPAVLDAIDRLASGDRGVRLVAHASYGEQPAQKLRYYVPAAPGHDLPALIFFHGGGWQSGDPDDYGFVARALAPEGFVVVLAGYRLGQEGRYPAMLQDAARAIAQARADVRKFGGDPDRIVLSGHSAGAYNAVQVVLEQRWLAEAGVPQSAIKGVAGLSGPYDFHPFTNDSAKLTFETVGAGPESQPVNHARGDAPAMLLVHGEEDTLVKPRNTRALAAALGTKTAQVETAFYPAMDHNAPLISLAAPWRHRRDVAARIATFARRVTDVSVPVQAERP